MVEKQKQIVYYSVVLISSDCSVMYCGALVVSNKLMYLIENWIMFVIFKAEAQVVSLYWCCGSKCWFQFAVFAYTIMLIKTRIHNTQKYVKIKEPSLEEFLDSGKSYPEWHCQLQACWCVHVFLFIFLFFVLKIIVVFTFWQATLWAC